MRSARGRCPQPMVRVSLGEVTVVTDKWGGTGQARAEVHTLK